MKPLPPRILTINGGSSSIKFALYEARQPLERRLHGKVDRIGEPEAKPTFEDPAAHGQASFGLAASAVGARCRGPVRRPGARRFTRRSIPSRDTRSPRWTHSSCGA